MFAEARADVIANYLLADWSLTDKLEAALHIANANLYVAKNAGRHRCVATAA
ncbi:hypothetical protein [Rhizobium sophoriradicis]|uniref:hypothetical protein n=1 Tax=Rhizobium sophoriradicis TaxID=1535245 RepID=UPI0015CA7C65|nr:hypothetical protein [Rhizobium sophoriradicis]UWU37243.1 hypothetical protein N2597_25070 [Rhizobium leguminosarum bv. phaseoli]